MGSGEGLITVEDKTVNDGHWHSISLQRIGKKTLLSLDGEFFSEGISPGLSQHLNLEKQYLYLGAEVWSWGVTEDTRKGYTGCIDSPMVNGVLLPFSQTVPTDLATLKKLSHIIPHCFGPWSSPGVCGSHPCQNGGTCKEKEKSFECVCHSRFTGKLCEIDSNPCASSPCLNNGYCINEKKSYRCECNDNTSGMRCQNVHCHNSPCMNGGYCEEGISHAICNCNGFSGNYCSDDINECEKNPCQSGGTCINTIGGFQCSCFTNTSGHLCDQPLVSPFSISVGAVSTIQQFLVLF